MRRAVITWVIVFGAILAAFGATVLVLNATLYSAAGFVQSYLDALARHDADGALDLANVTIAGDASDELLVAEAMGELGDIHLIGESSDGGVHRVTFGYSAGGVDGESTFEVERAGALFGIFSSWRFATSPLGTLEITVQHDSGFTANDLTLVAPQQDRPAPYLVFTPGTYELSHDSKFLHADTVAATSTDPAVAVPASIDVQANAVFVKQVQDELNDYLDECVTQEVLLPTGCPFGEEVGNRIVSTPTWSMTSYPQVTIIPAGQPATWLMPPTGAAAHLVVDIKSLFDGSVSTFDEDVPFSASYLITFLPDDELLITAQYG
jgi:hypothetical protein